MSRVRTKWLENWQPSIIRHDKQTDGDNCGVHVMEVTNILKRKKKIY